MDKSEKFWDRTAKNFDQQDDQYDPSYIETIKRYLGSDDTVLDFACGTGSFSCLIASDVKEVQAIDISAKMLEIAERKAAHQKIENINFTHGTLFDERLDAGSFNVILAFNILHLLKDMPQIMQRLYSLLGPGGYFISDTPCLGEANPLLRIPLTLISKLPILPDVENFRMAELKGVITNAKFQIAETQNLSESPPTLLIVAQKK